VGIVTKVCKLCEQEKPLGDFYSSYDKWANKKYVGTRCKPCHLKYKQDSLNTPKNRKREKLKLRYGLSYEQWEKIREEENFSCMICGISEEGTGKHLSVDHCHNSGKVRGVLCNSCNTMLGHAQDNIKILESAVNYLQNQGGGYK
jgi:nitrate/TMAO reductase-like tetraheme cytochrome c subunit